MRYWHFQGLKIIFYLDDGICASEVEPKALEASVSVHSALSQAGFEVNVEKSIWKPTQCIQWLGFVIYLSMEHIEIPAERLAVVKGKLQSICQLSLVPAKMLVSVVGSIISISLAIGPVSCFMTHCMYALLETKVSWWLRLEITPEAWQELKF